MNGALLEVNNLVTRFETRDGTINAVNGVSFALHEGETLAIVGESGCGKTVTVLSLIGLIPQPPGKIIGGEALYLGADLLSMTSNELQDIRGKEIGIVFQDPLTSLNPVLTIGRQITESLERHLGIDKRAAHDRAVDLLKMVNIPQAPDRFHDYPHQFSGGMRQRVMIAMAIACNPSILIADEPTTALDVTIQAQIISLIKRLRDEIGMAVIWISHDLGVVASLADRVLVMYAGFVIEEGSVLDVYERPTHPYTLGLLESVPKLDKDERRRLSVIEGVPPELTRIPKGCPFNPRCKFAVEKCFQERPPLIAVRQNHVVACWVDLATGNLR